MKQLFYYALVLVFFVPFATHAQQDSTIEERPIIKKKKKKKKKKSLYQTIYDTDGLPQMIIDTDLKQLIRKSMKEEYQESIVTINGENDETIISMANRLRARGNMRKQLCRFPPIKIDYKKGELDSLGFKKKSDKLKMVFPCRNGSSDQERMYKEHMLYDLYNVVDSNSLRSKLVDVEIRDEKGEVTSFVGMMLEDEQAYAYRKKAVVVEKGNLRSASFDRDRFIKMIFFQYMIANTDWSISNFHNIEIVKLPKIQRVVGLPYDFDYAGFVGHSYAIPHESLGIESVHERHFFNFKISEEEFNTVVAYFLAIEDDIYKVCDEASYLTPKTIKKSKDYLGSFFKLLRKPRSIKNKIVKRG